jgi:hypothetical protein
MVLFNSATQSRWCELAEEMIEYEAIVHKNSKLRRGSLRNFDSRFSQMATEFLERSEKWSPIHRVTGRVLYVVDSFT